MNHKIGLTVALFVSVIVAGCAPRSASRPAGSPSQPDQRPSVGVVVREFEFEPRPLRVKAGLVRFLLINRGSVEHDFAIPSLAGHADHERHLVKPGKTTIVELELKPGTYEATCTIPGHKEAGMVVIVEVSS